MGDYDFPLIAQINTDLNRKYLSICVHLCYPWELYPFPLHFTPYTLHHFPCHPWELYPLPLHFTPYALHHFPCPSVGVAPTNLYQALDKAEELVRHITEWHIHKGWRCDYRTTMGERQETLFAMI